MKRKPAKEQEGKLLGQLMGRYGYMMQDAPKGRRITMAMVTDHDTGRTTVMPMYVVTLIVPCSGALGLALAKRYEHENKAKPTKPKKGKRR